MRATGGGLNAYSGISTLKHTQVPKSLQYSREGNSFNIGTIATATSTSSSRTPAAHSHVDACIPSAAGPCVHPSSSTTPSPTNDTLMLAITVVGTCLSVNCCQVMSFSQLRVYNNNVNTNYYNSNKDFKCFLLFFSGLL